MSTFPATASFAPVASYPPAAPSGPPNLTLTSADTNPISFSASEAVGALTVNPTGVSLASLSEALQVVWVESATSIASVTMTGTIDVSITGPTIYFENVFGAVSFAGITLTTESQIILNNCRTLPTLPDENCGAVQIYGLSNTDTITVGTKCPHSFAAYGIAGNVLLRTVDLSGTTDFTNESDPPSILLNEQNLDEATVNAILAFCVAHNSGVGGNIALQNGTSAAPTGQGIIDAATLLAASPPWSVATN